MNPPVNRRRFLQLLGATTSVLLPRTVSAQAGAAYQVLGAGPMVLTFARAPEGYFEALAERYRVVVMDYPPPNPSAAMIDSFTADRVCRDILSVADEVGAERFAWYGFSWGGVVGLQLAARTARLSALVIGGWPPLEGQYAETLTVTERASARGEPAGHYAAFYRSLRGWPERQVVMNLTCPRMVFVGSRDEFIADGYSITHAALIAKHRDELERQGWVVRVVEGFGHELGGRPDVVTPLVRQFLDSLPLTK